MNYSHKKKNGKEMMIKVQIGYNDADFVILDLGSNDNILTKQTCGNMGKP